MPRSRSVVLWLLVPALPMGPSPRAQEPWAPGESDVLISEIHYHPPGDDRGEEFVELHNAGIRWVDLGGWTLQGGVELGIPPGTVLGPGEHIALGRDADSLRARGAPLAVGGWKGSLKNRGGILALSNRTGRLIATVHYRDGRGADGGLWPERPDGDGPSLELIQPHPDAHRPWYWAPSRAPGGTPGRENSRWYRADAARSAPRPDLRIHEYRLDDPGAFVEILNEGETVKLEGFRLTSHPRGEGGTALEGSAAKGKPALVKLASARSLLEAPAGAEADAEPDNGAAEPAKPGKAGKKKKKKDAAPERLFLVEAATGEMIDSVKLRRGAPAGGSFGLDPQTGNLVTFEKSTAGAPNAAPPASDLVIHEIHYNGQAGTPDEEFVEILNRGKAAVRLGGWKVDRAISFAFPEGASLPAGGFAVVAGSPEKIRAGLGKAEAALVFGPFDGELANSGEAIVLVNPRGDEADRVRYGDRPPWPREADGGGFSIELLHPDLDNRWAQAWTLGGPGGSPGRKNAHAVKTMPPAIAGVRHEPPVPGPEDQVTIHAQVVDNGGVSSVSVVYRDVAGGPAAKKATLADSGKAGDGAARDGHYAVKLPRLRPGAIVGFAIVAKDSSGRETRFPEGAGECYFQVEPSRRDGGALPGMPVYRIIMPPEAWDRLVRSPRRQDNLFPCTFIASVEGPGVNERPGDVFYSAGLRFRGNNSRNPPDGRMSYRLRIEGGGRFDGRDRFILNAYDSFRQKAGNDALRLAGVPTSNATVVRLKTPTLDDYRYVDIEVVNNEFLDERFGSSSGRVYRGTRGGGHGADLAWHGPNARGYEAAYKPMNKKRDPGMEDLLALLRALDERDPIAYVKKVEEALDPAEWAAYFAVNNVLGNDEGGITTDQPDDYFLAQRPDGKFLLVPWDQDSTFNVATLPLFRPRLPSVRRLIAHPRYAPYFHRAVRESIDGPLSLATFRRRQAHYRGIFADEDLAALDAFVERRIAFLRDRYPYAPVAGIAGAGEGWSPGSGTRTFLAGGGEVLGLLGRVDPAIAFGVRVAGSAAEYDALRGRFTWKGGIGNLAAGANAIWIECIGPTNEPTFAFPLNVERVPAMAMAGRTIDGRKEWLAASGPVYIEGELVVQPGATLRVGPGVSVVCAPGSSITVRGSISLEGSALEPITFRPADPERGWNGIRIPGSGAAGTTPRAVLRGCRFECGEGRGGASLEEEFEDEQVSEREAGAPRGAPAGDVFFRVDGGRVLLERCVFRGIHGTAVGLRGAHAEMKACRISSSRAGVVARGGTLIAEGLDVIRTTGAGLRLESLEEGSRVRAFRISETGDAGISIEKGKVVLEHGLLLGCESGLSISGGARVSAAQLTIAATPTAVEVDVPAVVPGDGGARTVVVPQGGRARPVPVARPRVSRAPSSGRSVLELTRSVIAPADVPLVAGDGAQVTLSHSVVAPASAEAPKGDGVLSAIPRFAAPGRGDFRLDKGSAGAGRGPGGADWGKVE